jgi:hypothetical protein
MELKIHIESKIIAEFQNWFTIAILMNGKLSGIFGVKV